MSPLKKSIYNLYLGANHVLGVTEKWFGDDTGDGDTPLPYPPVFILGAPRCGSTLLYQSMATAFEVAFLTNRHCLLHGSPWLTERLLDPASKYREYSFDSTHGKVQGPYSPSECGDFWYRFFPRKPQYAPLSRCNPDKLKALRTSFRAWAKAAQKPLLIKNLICVLRLEAILETLPEALFVVLHRDETDTAHSILESRKKRFGNYNEWFSTEPPEIEELKQLSPAEQAVGQIRSCHRLIAEAEEKREDAFFHLHYEAFCNDPRGALKKVQSFFEGHGLHIPMDGSIPERFKRRQEIRIDKELYNELIQITEKE